MIAPFIRWLDDMSMVDFGLVTDETDAGFDTRLRIQKYVFVAQRLGLGTTYRYNRYRYGPYSPGLTDDYYRLAENPATYEIESVRSAIPDGFSQDKFLGTVKGRSSEWLEVATTLIHISPQHDNTRDMLEHAAWIKRGTYAMGYIREVLGNLLKSPMGKSVSH